MQSLSRAENLAAWLCGAGLLLGVAGFWGMRHVPMTPDEEERERMLQEVLIPVDDMARHSPDNPQVQLMRKQLREKSIYQQRRPPYRNEGIIALSIGIALFTVGSVMWFRRAGRWRPSRWINSNEDA